MKEHKIELSVSSSELHRLIETLSPQEKISIARKIFEDLVPQERKTIEMSTVEMQELKSVQLHYQLGREPGKIALLTGIELTTVNKHIAFLQAKARANAGITSKSPRKNGERLSKEIRFLIKKADINEISCAELAKKYNIPVSRVYSIRTNFKTDKDAKN